MKRLIFLSTIALGLQGCAETNPSRHSARDFAQGRTFLDAPRIIEPSEDRKAQIRRQREEMAAQARKLGDNVRAQRILTWPDRYSWTEEKLAKRNESGVWFAEQDPSPGLLAEPDIVRAFMSDRTKTSWSQGYGLQVSYNAPDGSAYLWYPGNNVILRGEWKVEKSTQLTGGFVFVEHEGNLVKRDIDSAQVCYRYGANTVDGVTGSRGGRFQCQSWGYFKETGREYRKGDTFGLATRTQPPFILSKEEDKIANLLKKAQSGGTR